MKAQQIIHNYCRLYGAKEPQINSAEKRYFVVISIEETKVFYWRENSTLLGKIIGSEMKRAVVLLIEGNKVSPLTWEQWTTIWQRLFTPKCKNKKTSPSNTPSQRSEIFQLMQQKRISRKPQKRGFERTYIANSSMNFL